MIAAEVALAFNGVNERKMWAARPHAKGGNELVHFTASTNLISLVLDCNTLKFQVRFNKVHASWGDYVRSIARSLHVVLTTLKASGLPFDCPDVLEGAEIVTTVGDGVTYVSMPVAHDPIMPELKGEPVTFNLFGTAPPADDVPAFGAERTEEPDAERDHNGVYTLEESGDTEPPAD